MKQTLIPRESMKTRFVRCLLIWCGFALPIWSVAQSPTQPKPAPFPLQLEICVPFEPTAFPSEGRTHLMYELHLTNFGSTPLYLRRLEVLDVGASPATPITTFSSEQLVTMLGAVGMKASTDANGTPQIPGGGSAIVFVSIGFDRDLHIPDKILHRVVTTDSQAEGAVISTHHTTLHVLGP